MKESKAPYIILLIFLAGLIALYISLDNQPRAEAFEYHLFDEDMVYFRTDYYHQFEEAEDYMLIDNTYFSIKK